MNRRPCRPRAGLRAIAGAALLASFIAGRSPAQDGTPPLARYVPSEGLAVLIEHDGLDARPGAWAGTAASKMLAETPLGTMLGEITVQLLDRALMDAPGRPATGKDVTNLLEHLARKGFVVGYCGSLNPPQPRAAVVVIRGAEGNETFRRLIAKVPPLNEPAAKKAEQPGGRTVRMVAGAPVRWWYEKGDAVFSFAPPGGPDPVADTLDGKSPSAVDHPARKALAQAGPGEVPVGRIFVDVTALPPLPPDAAGAGLDAIQRVEAKWSIREKALSATLAVRSPRPRRGVLALFDQPAIAPGTAMALPAGVTDFAMISVDPIKTGDAILAMMARDDPGSAAGAARIAATFKERTGLSLRDDLIAKLGPRAAFYTPGGGSALGMLGMWFHPPDLGAVFELKDAAGFAANLDKLMVAANRELKAAGELVPAVPGRPVRPGAAFAEFRRLKDLERGYVLAIPPSVLPTPAGLRPTVIVDPSRKLVALGGSPASARRALASLTLGKPGAKAAAGEGAGEFLRVRSDPSGSLPELLVSLPSLVQFVGISAAQPNGGRPAGRPFRLEIDPDAIPEAGALRPYLFPSNFAIAADDASIRMTVDTAFPLPIPTLNAGIETPVLIALLLPAVQSAREAARRSQCVNNLKQIGLAMHNHHDAVGNFPGSAIADKQGKPLLSWRVAILPYIEQVALYNEFHLDEPWDSEHNKALIPRMPAVFACPSRGEAGGPGLTPYRVFDGPGALFDATRPVPGMAVVTDGISNTLMVVEAADSVPWTKPEGLISGPPGALPEVPLFGLGSRHPGGFNALFADGSVRFIKSTVNLEVLRALITRAGGEIVSRDAF